MVNENLAKRKLSFSPDLLTVDLYSVHLLSRVDIVIRYIEVDFTLGLSFMFVISRFYFIHFTVTLAGT